MYFLTDVNITKLRYASFSNKLDVFSNRCKYYKIESIIEKYMGKQNVFERTARFEVCLFIPKIYF